MRISCVNFVFNFDYFPGEFIDNDSLGWAMSLNFVPIEYHASVEDVKWIIELVDVLELGGVLVGVIATVLTLVSHFYL